MSCYSVNFGTLDSETKHSGSRLLRPTSQLEDRSLLGHERGVFHKAWFARLW